MATVRTQVRHGWRGGRVRTASAPSTAAQSGRHGPLDVRRPQAAQWVSRLTTIVSTTDNTMETRIIIRQPRPPPSGRMDTFPKRTLGACPVDELRNAAPGHGRRATGSVTARADPNLYSARRILLPLTGMPAG